ncbi:MAG TPA: histidine kinase dimerization/phospho-acceptor domain-containing protein [Candidatus Brocadiia bacterium]|nr:histidine kinase dimerization/phospho-acceptor domain-containing protein [Candidatus Brocadiia bacterium]
MSASGTACPNAGIGLGALEALLAHEDEARAKEVCEQMAALGHQCFPVKGLAAAVARLNSQAVDALLVDLPLGELATAPALAAAAARAGEMVTIVLVDAAETGKAAETLLPLGAEYLVRGPKWEGLARVKTLVRDARMRRSRRAEPPPPGSDLATAELRVTLLSRFMAGLTHDLNNALSGVMGYSSLLAHKLSPTDPSVKFLTSITDAAERAARLAEQGLQVARSPSSASRALSLPDFLGGARDLLTAALPRNVTLEMDFEEGLRPVLLESSLLADVLLALCLRAGDIGAGRSATVRIEARNQAGPPPRVTLSILRDGEGHEPKDEIVGRGGIRLKPIRFEALRALAEKLGGALDAEPNGHGGVAERLSLPAK